MKSLGVTSLYVADDGSDYGKAIADAREHRRARRGSDDRTLGRMRRSAATSTAPQSPSAAAKFFNHIAGMAPHGEAVRPLVAEQRRVHRRRSQLAVHHLYVSIPGFCPRTCRPRASPSSPPSSAAYGHAPNVEAIFGYEAMSAVLRVLQKEGEHADDRGDGREGLPGSAQCPVGARDLLDRRRRQHEPERVRLRAPQRRQARAVRRCADQLNRQRKLKALASTDERLMLRLGTLLKRSLGPTVRCASRWRSVRSRSRPAVPSAQASARSTTTKAVSKSPPKNDHVLYIYSGLPLRGPRTEQVPAGAAGHRVRARAGRQEGRRLPDQVRRRPATRRHGQALVRGGAGTLRKKANQLEADQHAAGTRPRRQGTRRRRRAIRRRSPMSATSTRARRELSLPILNQAGIVQLTPGSGYPGLTDNLKWHEPDDGRAQVLPAVQALAAAHDPQRHRAGRRDVLAEEVPTCHTRGRGAFSTGKSPSTRVHRAVRRD